jgi:hypothetical protein
VTARLEPRRLLLWVIVAVSVSAAKQAMAEFNDGNVLYTDCFDQSYYKRAFCLGYIEGIADGLGSNAINGYTACLPRGVEARQVRDVITRFLASHPETRHLMAASLVARALAEAFPCRMRGEF